MIEKIKNLIFGKKEELKYPLPCGFIQYTDTSKMRNVKDDQNKIIMIYKKDKFGNVSKQSEVYHPAKVKILEDRGIPVFDKTKMEERFDVLFHTEPDEIIYNKI